MRLNLPSKAQVLLLLTPALAYGLSIVCPAIPSWAWNLIIKAVLNGDVTFEHLAQFMKDHGIEMSHAAKDFPPEKDGAFAKMPPATGQPNSNTNQVV